MMRPDFELAATYCSRAKDFLSKRWMLQDATDREIASIARGLRYEDFRATVRPFEQMKNRIASLFVRTATTLSASYPPEVQKNLDLLDELIAIEARKFGFEVLK